MLKWSSQTFLPSEDLNLHMADLSLIIRLRKSITASNGFRITLKFENQNKAEPLSKSRKIVILLMESNKDGLDWEMLNFVDFYATYPEYRQKSRCPE